MGRRSSGWRQTAAEAVNFRTAAFWTEKRDGNAGTLLAGRRPGGPARAVFCQIKNERHFEGARRSAPEKRTTRCPVGPISRGATARVLFRVRRYAQPDPCSPSVRSTVGKDLPKSFKTPSGAEISAIGLGTWQSKPDETAEAVKLALHAGYRHIDNAPGYGNEAAVGQGIRASGVPREQIWVTSKVLRKIFLFAFIRLLLNREVRAGNLSLQLWCDKHVRPQSYPERVVRRPGRYRFPHTSIPASVPRQTRSATDVGEPRSQVYVDLYLIHWPLAFAPSDEPFGIRDKDNRVILEAGVTIEDTWKAMEGLVDDGLAKNIGVSNFNIENLKRVLKVAKKPITTNQIEVHPYLPQEELISFCKDHNILVTAYAPLGGPANWRSIQASIPRVESTDPNQLKDATAALGAPSDQGLIKNKTVCVAAFTAMSS
ncbi:MAG: NADP-dependent oxidoreductase domain-containing protein [Olpidium bornovanus]|uniref:NADP-dependent oxidoreductase domain-containing protein n=1 Tax=Olpidium bornovanus TaxID=278681 RepID=A0A8H7ZT74_9FUNG|nr:MAG: NADP-dependent oxidoreductase domain-containing protein [Olpidium bornovanus]